MGANNRKCIEELISGLQVEDSEDQLIIGLDFGTTFSGIAYAFRDKQKIGIISIEDWPGLEAVRQPKVPTIISYDPKDMTSYTWGEKARVQREGSKIEAIKLLLDPDQEKPLYVPETNTRAEIRKMGKPPLDVAADYLEALYKHAMSRVESKVMIKYLDMCQKKFVLSVPAVWSDKGLDNTMRAAKKAGIYPVTLIKEPEAAALYTLYDLQNRGLGVGDAVVICDAGGGTVDLISYEISSLIPSLQVKELVPSKGGMAGSLMLNKRFEEKVKYVVGEDQYHDLRKTPGYTDTEAVNFFDRTVKMSFRDSPDERWYANFPGAGLEDDPDNDIKNDTWLLKSETVKEIFNPLINNIKEMIDHQVSAVRLKRLSDGHGRAEEVKAIFLVGGFGSSEYLKQTIQNAHQDIQVIQPHNAWSAIVKGAVLSQLPQEALVTSSVATRHYGVSALFDYDEVRDKDQAKTRNESTGKWRVEKMTWYIYKNEDLKRDQKIKFNFYRTLREDYTDDQLVFHDELITDDNIHSAIYPKSGVTKTNCFLKADLRNVDRSSFKKRLGVNGTWYVDVSYDLIVTIKSAQMKFSLEIKGEELGAVDANYD